MLSQSSTLYKGKTNKNHTFQKETISFIFNSPTHFADSISHSGTINNKNYKTEYAVSTSISKAKPAYEALGLSLINLLPPRPLLAACLAMLTATCESREWQLPPKAAVINYNTNFFTTLSKHGFFSV